MFYACTLAMSFAGWQCVIVEFQGHILLIFEVLKKLDAKMFLQFF